MPAYLVLIAFQAAVASMTVPLPQSSAGEYTFQVLSADEPGADTLASGRFVLSSTPLELSRLPAELVRKTRAASRWFFRSSDVLPNTCFGFELSPAEVDGREFYGGIIAAGFSQWRADDGQIRVHVYQSPDASQYLLGRQTAEGIVGWVEQHNFDGTSHMAWLPFRAQRVGPPGVDRCQAALELATRHVRRHNTSEARDVR